MTQGEVERLSQPLQRIYSDLETRIMSDIVERIRINGFSTATADWEISRLQQLGESEETIRGAIREALQASDEEIERIFSDEVYKQYTGSERAYRLSGIEQIPYEQNVPLKQLVEATQIQISKEYQNLANSMGFAIRDKATGKITYSPLMTYYRTTLDNAVIDIASGAFSYNVVLTKTINQMTSSGLRYIDYNSGHRDRVDVAARRAVLTGFRQVQAKINEQTAKDIGTDYYEVSWHMGSRPSHQTWQGHVYSHKDLEDVCGLGTVTGLCGANCYHSYLPFVEGVSVRTYTDEWLEEQNEKENTPKEYNGKQYTTYEALQEQRRQERNMRKTRQDIDLLQKGNADKDTITLKKARYQGQMQQYKAFSEKMDLPLQRDRIYQDGLGNVMKKSVANNLNSDIIKTQEMLRKNSKDTREGFKFVSETTFNNLTITAKKHGALIIRGTEEVEKHLDDLDAAASNIGDIILFRKNVCISEVLEETYHFEQNIKKMNDDKGEPLRSILNEIDAKQYLLDNAQKYKIPRNEIELTRKQLESYKKQLEKYQS